MKVVITLLILFSFISCKDNNITDIEKIGMVDIYKSVIPDTSNINTSVGIKTYAVAYNGCWNNLYFELTKINDFEYSLKAFGTLSMNSIACPDVLVYKDTTIVFTPIAVGIYKFHISKMNTEVVIDTMVVR